MSIEYSVIIPTFERMDVLPEVLTGLEGQERAPSFEVIVVDDGSEDGTADFLEAYRGELPLTILRQPNRGPATARNRGVAEAQGQRVAFLGDDTVPSPGWLAAHDQAFVATGKDAAVAVIGYTSWHPRMPTSPFLHYINEYGAQFGYALIDDPAKVPFNFFYTSNLSLSRELLVVEPFDLGFPYAAWEDIEVAYRLEKRGMRLIYAADATVQHDHPTSLSRFAERQERAGYSAVVFHRLHPELGGFLGLGPDGPPPIPSRSLQALREGLARVLQFFPVETPRLWDEILRFHYIRGLQRGWRARAEGDKT